MKHYYKYFKIFFLIPIILILFVIKIFKNFNINRIRSKKIGDFTTPLEIYICEKKDNPKKIPNIWYMDKNIANEFLKKKWKKELIILPREILEPIYLLFKKFKFFNFFFEDYSKASDEVKRSLRDSVKYIDNKNVVYKYKPSIEFDSTEKNIGENYLKKIGFQNKKFVIFSSRTAEFHNEKDQSTRNSNIENQILGINFLVSKGFKAIRMGKNEKKKINFSGSNIIDYATSFDRSDFLDVYLTSKCEFMISSESGINELAVLFRKPRLVVDHYYCGAYEKYASRVIVLPKKFKNLNTENIISFDEAYKKKLNHVRTPSDVRELGYEVLDNSKYEIKEATESMFSLINNDLNFNEILQNQKNFWQNLEKNHKYKKNNKVIICPNFYLNNIDLFE